RIIGPRRVIARQLFHEEQVAVAAECLDLPPEWGSVGGLFGNTAAFGQIQLALFGHSFPLVRIRIAKASMTSPMWAGDWPLSSHSHTVSTCQPRLSNWPATFLSRSRLVVIFCFQKSGRDFGHLKR